MLGRTAHGIFWMARYLERAENTARLLDAGFRMALTRGIDAASEEWRSVLVTIGQQDGYDAQYAEYTGTQVTNFVLRGADNPGSVLQMIELARTNARIVRTAITREVWEATNESWLELGRLLARPVRIVDLGEVLGRIRRQATLVRGAMEGTMLRTGVFNFARIGTHLERADNTARILDVKYHVLLPSAAWVGTHLDNAQWEMVLRSVAGERAFRWLNAGNLDPAGIAEFLILDPRFPRSIAFCHNKLASNLASLAIEHGRECEAHARLREARSRLADRTVAQIIEFGLHQFITGLLVDNRAIADAIAAEYRFTE